MDESYSLAAFRARIRTHVREDLDRVNRPAARSAIDLSRVPEAEQAAERNDRVRVLELLGAWPAPLAIFLRTPEGQMLNPETRSVIARAPALLGGACITLEEVGKGEEILRLGIQYAADGPAAPDVFLKLGEAIFADGRTGEAIGPLRRAANLGAALDRGPGRFSPRAFPFSRALPGGRCRRGRGPRPPGTAGDAGFGVRTGSFTVLGKPYSQWRRCSWISPRVSCSH